MWRSEVEGDVERGGGWGVGRLGASGIGGALCQTASEGGGGREGGGTISARGETRRRARRIAVAGRPGTARP